MATRRPPADLPTEPSSRPGDVPPTADGSFPRSRQSYRTGSSYPGGEEEGSHSLEGRDIYGENDPLPDEEESQAGTDLAGSPSSEPDATRAGPPCKFIVTAGPDKGKVRRFSGVRMVVGRTPGCAILLMDTAVSRRHLEMVYGAEGVLLRDLGSGNGTRVNGQPFTEGLLKHLDVIELGQTKLQFIDEAEERKQAIENEKRKQEEEKKRIEQAAQNPSEQAAVDTPPPVNEPSKSPQVNAAEQNLAMSEPEMTRLSAAKAELRKVWKKLDRRRQVIASALLVATGLTMFVVLPIILRPHGPPPLPPREVAARGKIEAAQVALSEGRHSDAIDALDSAERLWPGIDKAGVGTRIRVEVSAHRSLDNARGLLRQHRFEEAWSVLAEVPEASEQLIREKKSLESELDARQSEFVESKIDEALNQLDVESAKQTISKLPEERQELFLPKLRQAEAKLAEQKKLEDAKAAQEQENTRRREEEERQARVGAAFRGVERKFHAQEFDRAILECDRVMDASSDAELRERAVQLKRLIPQFYRTWLDAQRKLKLGAMESARESFRKSKELYEQIQLPGILGAELDDQLLQTTLASGSAALSRDDLMTALLLFNDALKISPKEAKAEEGLLRIARKADEIYLDAYSNRDRDPKAALEKYKLILEVAPKDSEVYRKAQEQLRLVEP